MDPGGYPATSEGGACSTLTVGRGDSEWFRPSRGAKLKKVISGQSTRVVPCPMPTVKRSFAMAGMVAACLGMATSPLLAQKPGGEGSREGPPQSSRGNGPRSLMQNFPVLAALDADGNNEISAAEIAAASAALKTLDKNKDGKLTGDELRPRFAPPSGRPGRNESTPAPPAKDARPARPSAPVPKAIGGLTPGKILKLLGARGLEGATERTLEGYRRVFGFTDFDKDGRHSKKEYIDGGRYLTRESRAGIFQASDVNGDGFVSEKEYVENRVITDEAKEIFESMDRNSDSRLTAAELIASKKLKDGKLAQAVFEALDVNGDGELNIPEYLRGWGRWARS